MELILTFPRLNPRSGDSVYSQGTFNHLQVDVPDTLIIKLAVRPFRTLRGVILPQFGR